MKKTQIGFIVIFTAMFLFIGSYTMAEPNDSKPKVGDTCENKSFTPFCNGDFVMRCVRGKVKAIDCASRTKVNQGYTCAEFVISGRVDCISDTDQCYVENDKIAREKQSYSGKTRTEFYRCEKTANQKLYYRRISVDTGQQTSKTKDILIIKVQNVKAGDKCKIENEIIEIEQTTKEGKAKPVLLHCKKDSNGELTYISKKSKKSDKSKLSDQAPRDSQIDLPFGGSDESSDSKKKSSHKKSKDQADGRPRDRNIDLPF